ncbi:MAG: hypothetical protein LBI92_06060 [Azoarcus sp.]|nr:hypothetical protein [Azoarcus sp.]
MSDLSALKSVLLDAGACRVGFADLSSLSADVKSVFHDRLRPDAAPEPPLRGISIAVSLPPDVLAGLGDGPTRPYYDAYGAANQKLDALALRCACWLENAGFRAWAQTRDHVSGGDTLNEYATRLPHKTVATLAGMGWIGKDALLVTKEFGSAVRLTSVLTDAPLPADAPVTVSHCGSCNKCIRICPAGALRGVTWQPGITATADLVDVENCSKTAARLSLKNYGIDFDICGMCFYVCPFTRKWLHKALCAPGYNTASPI